MGICQAWYIDKILKGDKNAMNTLAYNGYIARIDADLNDGILVGGVIDSEKKQ